MNVTDPGFYIFLASALVLFYAVPSALRVLVLLSASYIYVGLFDPRAVLYLAFVTAFSFGGALAIARFSELHRLKGACLALFIGGILAVLAATKYLEVILASFYAIAGRGGAGPEPVFRILVPLGLSYYSFQSIGYLLDVHWEKRPPERNILKYALFLAFFPKIVSGPIERSDGLLCSIDRLPVYRFEYNEAKRGLLLIGWGLFLKLILADNLGVIVNRGYSDPSASLTGISPEYFLLYYLQLYYDFSGYTRIARGAGFLFGLPLRKNFDHPFLATTMQDFWRRWHLSLSTWINDYLYFPLRMRYRRAGTKGLFYTLILTFLVLGIWHGATLPYAVFGLYHGCVMCVSTWSLPRRDRFWEARGQSKSLWLLLARRTGTFAAVCIGMGIFRCASGGQLLDMLRGLGQLPWLLARGLPSLTSPDVLLLLLLVLGTECVHMTERNGALVRILYSDRTVLRWSLYLALSLVLLLFGNFHVQPAAIYAQF